MIAITLGTCACGYRGTLVNDACGFCSDRQDATPKVAPPARTINDLFAALLAEFADEEIAAPLAQRLTLSHVWCDLARLAGELPPSHVLAALDEPIHAAPLRPPVETHREPAYLPA